MISEMELDEEQNVCNTLHVNQLEHMACKGCYIDYLKNIKGEIRSCELQHKSLFDKEICEECGYLDNFERSPLPMVSSDEMSKDVSFCEQKTTETSSSKETEIVQIKTSSHKVFSVNLTTQRVKWLNLDMLSHPLCSSKNTAIIHTVDAIGLEPEGFSLDLSKKYPYCNIYSRRRRYKKTNRAEIADRDTPGDIIISRSQDIDSPTIISFVNSFFKKGPAPTGVPLSELLNYGMINVSQVSKIKKDDVDFHIYNQLLKDDSYNRRKWFKANLMNLFHFLYENRSITDVCFPFRLNESRNFEWASQLTLIEELSRYIYPNFMIHIIRHTKTEIEEEEIIEIDSDSTTIDDDDDDDIFKL